MVHTDTDTVPPGSTLGVLGSGQLGRMFCRAAQDLGYRVAVFSEAAASPAGQVADQEFVGRYDSRRDAAEFARLVQAATYEFENIPAAAVQACLDRGVPVRPGLTVLQTAQDRIREKTHLQRHGFPVSPFVPLIASAPIPQAAAALSYPCLLKTARFGYDGKGQAQVAAVEDLAAAWETLGRVNAILECRVAFTHEVSVLMARSPRGEEAVYPVVLNHHRNHILDISVAPAPIPAATAARAQDLTRAVADSLALQGLFCIEFFVLPTGELLINEIAPRTHNTGHWTLEGCTTSQFAQQTRALCNLPLGSTDMTGYAAMANLLGDLWPDGGDLDTTLIEWDPDTVLHLYGKHSARPERKMGHLTTIAATPQAAVARLDAVRRQLSGWPVSDAFLQALSPTAAQYTP